jgi:hypothetical protein
MMSGGEGRGGEGGWGQKVLSKPSADSFAVGRRQKEFSFSPDVLVQFLQLTHSRLERRRAKGIAPGISSNQPLSPQLFVAFGD